MLKEPIYRNPKWLADAKEYVCIRCGKPGETRSCHYNGWRAGSYGKGRGIKCADFLVADFCQACDDLFSEKSYPLWDGGSKNLERSEEFHHWCVMSLNRRLANGWRLVK